MIPRAQEALSVRHSSPPSRIIDDTVRSRCTLLTYFPDGLNRWLHDHWPRALCSRDRWEAPPARWSTSRSREQDDLVDGPSRVVHANVARSQSRNPSTYTPHEMSCQVASVEREPSESTARASIPRGRISRNVDSGPLLEGDRGRSAVVTPRRFRRWTRWGATARKTRPVSVTKRRDGAENRRAQPASRERARGKASRWTTTSTPRRSKPPTESLCTCARKQGFAPISFRHTALPLPLRAPQVSSSIRGIFSGFSCRGFRFDRPAGVSSDVQRWT